MSKFNDKYEIIEKLGSGGMGTVYKARVKNVDGFNKMVAVKRVNEVGDSKNNHRSIINEARLLSSLNHPNICHCYDYIEEGNEGYIILEYIDGTSLFEILHKIANSKSFIQEPHLIEIAWQILSGLEYLQNLDNTKSQTIIHGDLCPQNIMISKDGVIKILDFGISKSLADNKDFAKTINQFGKLNYIAPEIIDTQKYSTQSELYSVGVILYELTTGSTIFRADTLGDTVNLIKNYDPEPINRVRADISESFSQFISRLISKSASDRPVSVHAALNELEKMRLPISGTKLSNEINRITNLATESAGTVELPKRITKYRAGANSLFKNKRSAKMIFLVAAMIFAFTLLLYKTSVLPLSTSARMTITIQDNEGNTLDISSKPRDGIDNVNNSPEQISELACNSAAYNLLLRTTNPWYRSNMDTMSRLQGGNPVVSEVLDKLLAEFNAEESQTSYVLNDLCGKYAYAKRAQSELNERLRLIKLATQSNITNFENLEKWLRDKYPLSRIQEDETTNSISETNMIYANKIVNTIVYLKFNKVYSPGLEVYSITTDKFPNNNHECHTLGETIWLLQYKSVARNGLKAETNIPIERILVIPENSGEITGYADQELHFRAFDGAKSSLLTAGFCYYERQGLESSFYDRFRPEYVK